jgi:hypothetical protein
MEGQIQQRFLFLDSGGASFTSDSKFYFIFPKGIDLGPPHSNTRCVVQSFSGFISQYNVNGYNNTLNLVVGGVPRSITVFPGQYDTLTLAAWLNDAVNEIDITYDVDQVKFVLTSASSFTLSGDSTILTVLGFEPGVTLTGTSLQSTRLINLAGARFVEIQSSLTNNNVRNNEMSTLTLARIPLSGYSFGELIHYEPFPLGISIKDHSLTYLYLTFTDDSGNPYDFGTLPWSLVLHFQSEPNLTYQPLAALYEQNSITQ